jgi:hypothetical protein
MRVDDVSLEDPPPKSHDPESRLNSLVGR